MQEREHTVELPEEETLELVEEEERTSKKEELVSLYVLSFNLPSSAMSILKREVEVSEKEDIGRRVEVFDRKIRGVLDGLRSRFYESVRKIFHTSVLGWVTVDPTAKKLVEEYNRIIRAVIKDVVARYIDTVIELLKQRGREELVNAYRNLRDRLLKKLEDEWKVRIVKVYLEPDDAVQILREVVESIRFKMSQIDEKIKIVEKMREAEEKKKRWRLNKLRMERKVLEEKLEKFERFLKMVEEK